jgi:hypothetical protein
VIFGAVECEPWGGYLYALDIADGVRRADTLSELVAAVRPDGRETMTLLCTDSDAFARAAFRDGVPLTECRIGASGISGITVAARVRVRPLDAFLPRAVMETLTGGALGILQAKLQADAALVLAGGNPPSGSLSGDWAALARAQSGAWGYPHDPELTRVATEAVHAGLSEVWQESPMVAVDGADLPPASWAIADDRVTLPRGYRLYDVDRDSAYAGECQLPLPATHTTARDDLLGAFGGVAEVTVDLAGWTGEAWPVSLQGNTGARSFQASSGAWRGCWATPLLRYALQHGARVEVHRAWSWGHGRDFLGSFTRAVWERKRAAAKGSVERAVLSAALQRTVGYLARRPGADEIIGEDDFAAELRAIEDGEDTGRARVRAFSGPAFGAYIVRREVEDTDAAKWCYNPVWSAIIVARTWVRMCEELARIRAAGGTPLYADTDGALFSGPSATFDGAYPLSAEKPGQWTLRGAPHWAWVEARKIYARGTGAEIEHAASAGVPRHDLIAYLSGHFPPERTESVKEQMARAADGPPLKLQAWKQRTKRHGR